MAGLAFAGAFAWAVPRFRFGVPHEGQIEESLKPGRDKNEHWEVAVSMQGDSEPVRPTLTASSKK